MLDNKETKNILGDRLGIIEQSIDSINFFCPEYKTDGQDVLRIDGFTYVLDQNEQRNPVLVPYNP